MIIYLGSDHAGFKLKEIVKKYLDEYDIKFIDKGNLNLQPGDDYPFFAFRVAKQVTKNRQYYGLLFCGNAQGVCMAANKVAGVRAAIGYSDYGARTSRLDDDSNILCIPSRVVTAQQAKRIIKVWLETEFSGQPRHQRRLHQLLQIEQNKYKSLEIIPAILEKNFAGFQRKVKKIERYFPLAQIDVADGTFVSNKTFSDWKKIRSLKTKIDYELHLMVDEPEKYLQQINNFRRIIRVVFHYESQAKPAKLIKYLHQAGTQAAIAINPTTSVKKIRSLLRSLDAVLVMGVKPGFYGSKFIDPSNKIKQLRQWNKKVKIIVDGGVNAKNAKKLIAAGADALVVGSYLNKNKNWDKAIQKLRGIK